MSAANQDGRAPWLLAVSTMLTLSAVSLLLPHTPAEAQAPRVQMAGVTAHVAPAVEGDGDGDELLEHWGDPKFRQEQHIQIAGMAVFFGGLGALSARRRKALRRARHD